MRNSVCMLLVVAMLFAGCAGREAHPIVSFIPGDEKKSCLVLRAELAQIEAEIQNKLPKSDKTGGNILLGVAGAFLIVPWFFMDLKGAEKIEVEAMQRRYNALSLFAADKNCDIATISTEVAKSAQTETNNPEDTTAMKAEIAKLRQELAQKVQVSNAAVTETPTPTAD